MTDLARAEKACRIADFLEAEHVTAEEVLALPDDIRTELCRHLGLRPASPQVWLAVALKLDARRAAKAAERQGVDVLQLVREGHPKGLC